MKAVERAGGLTGGRGKGVGFTGADLANLLNEAAILTARRRKTATSLAEIDDAVDRVIAGMEGTPLTDGRSKRLIAYHEVGHALVGTLGC